MSMKHLDQNKNPQDPELQSNFTCRLSEADKKKKKKKKMSGQLVSWKTCESSHAHLKAPQKKN